MRPLALPGLLLSLFLVSPASAAPAPQPYRPGAWGASGGADPCGSETLLEIKLAQDPALRERRAALEAILQQAQRRGMLRPESKTPGATALTGLPTYLIPVAVHIVHSGVPVGTQENLTDNQVQSQIDALNRDFENLAPLPSAVDTKIKFCLATNLPPSSPVVWSTTPGITRTSSPETNHTFANLASETALKAIDYLPADKYLNIWVVKTISGGGGGVAGYGTFPGSVPLTLDGIVMRYDCFGSNTTGWGTFTLLPSNSDGKILTHEVGHYLNLYHTFHGGCTPPGDQVTDTPAEAVNNVGCPGVAPTSCTASPDPIQNYMDYTNDACRFAFTNGQTTRMYAAITANRSVLVSASNLIAAGCSSGLNALISASPGQVCAGGTIQFSTPAVGAGYTYAWSFPGGTPATANTQNASSTFPTAGTYGVTLTVTDPSSNFSTNTINVYVVTCAPILGPCTNWVFSSHCALSFATGVPVAFTGTQNTGAEAATTMSDAAGNLIFYSDNLKVWDKNNNVMPNGNGIIGGSSSHNGAISIKRPGSSTQYFMFNLSEQENNFVTNPLRYSVIDMNLNAGLGDVVAGQKNLPIALPSSPNFMLEGQTLIPHCNGVDWWLITHGAASTGSNLYVTLVTAAGPVSSIAYPIGMGVTGGPLGAISPTLDGTKIATCWWSSGILAVYDFDRTTGVPTTSIAPFGASAYQDVCFSPNKKLLYYSVFTGSSFGLRQMEIATLQTRDLLTGMGQGCDVELGPDGKVYVGGQGASAIHVINLPDNFNTYNANECGLNMNSIPLGGGTNSFFAPLPNTVLACTNGPQPAQFTSTVTNCTQVSFHAVNCAGPYSWNFGDFTPTGSGQNVVHTYATPGSYNVTLTVSGASPASVMHTVNLTMSPISIAGPAPTCSSPSNYSAVGPAGYTYAWTVSGGAPATATGNNVDVTWTPSGGTVTLTATDPNTGCTTTVSKAVGWCPTCVKPPLGMTAWWPLDEPTGTIAQEIVAGNDGQDINAPPHVPGKVHRGRQFSFNVHDYVRVNDESRLNFGTGDFTIDAWVKTTSAEDPLPIVDKRTFSPERGVLLFLRAGRLGLRVGDGVTGTDYVSTGPLVNDGSWHHVAAVEKRNGGSTGTRLFVDGAPAAVFAAISGTANLTNTERLLIGGLLPNSLSPAFWFEGVIDEVELFNRALTPAEVAGIAAADTLGKCKEYCQVPWGTVICANQTSVIVTMNVCNFTTAAQSYNLNFSGLPAGSPGVGVGCTYAGPSSFVVLGSTPVNVPANSCVPVQVQIARPPGMPVGSSACFSVTVTNLVTGARHDCHGSLFASKLCGRVVGPPFNEAGVGVPTNLRFQVSNADPSPITLPVQVQALASHSEDGTAEPAALGLNGLPPGEPYRTMMTIPARDSAVVEVAASFSTPQVFRFYDVVLGLDGDFDGVDDLYTSAAVRYAQHISPPAGVEEGSPQRLALLPVSPNPLRGFGVVSFELSRSGPVTLALHDVGGRRVKTLVAGTREPGRYEFRIDVRDVKTGVYFVRLDTAEGRASKRIVVIR